MDLAVLIVGIIIGFAAAYFTVGPGKEQMKKPKQTRTVKDSVEEPLKDYPRRNRGARHDRHSED